MTPRVEILPETSKISDGLKRALLGVDDDVRKAAKRWKRIIDRELSGEEVTVEVRADTKKAKADIDKTAKDKTVTVDVDADTTAAEAKIDALSRDRKVELKVDVDKGAAVFGSLASSAAEVGTQAGGALVKSATSSVSADGPLATDSALFQQPDQGHRTSPFFRLPLKLHTVAEARVRYNDWAAEEFDRIHSGPQGGWVDEKGVMHENPRPENPYREKASAR